jgi:predicted nucleic acid-binding protein
VGQKSHADTSWVIALFNPDDSHHKQALRELEELNSPPSLSAFALAELLVDFEKSDTVDVNTTFTSIEKSFSPIVNLTSKIALEAATIRSNNKVTLGDAIIIASALHEKSQLLTFDKTMRAIYERIK